MFGVIFPLDPVMEEAAKMLKTDLCTESRCQADKILSSTAIKKGSPFKPPTPQALGWNPKVLYSRNKMNQK